MKIKSLLLCNVSLIVKGTRIVLPANPSVLELDDKQYKAFIPRLSKLVKEESAKWIKTPELTKEQVEAKKAQEVKAAEALLAANAKK